MGRRGMGTPDEDDAHRPERLGKSGTDKQHPKHCWKHWWREESIRRLESNATTRLSIAVAATTAATTTLLAGQPATFTDVNTDYRLTSKREKVL
jgi:hypothetical protein